jgi:endo-1,4-beta-D-glucanase Y
MLSIPNSHQQRLAVAFFLAITFFAINLHAQSKWPLWDQYSHRFINGDGRVIDHTGDDRTTSEAQAYGMFFSIVAGDKATFDTMLTWTENNLAQGDLTLHLPAWDWGKGPDGIWKPLDINPATDADLWLTYDLLEAGRLWNNPRYTNLGRTLINRIAKQEIATIPCVGPHGGPMLLPAPSGFHPQPDAWIVNPSYLPLPVLQRLATEQPGGPWYTIIAELPQLLGQTSVAGYSMDWVECRTGHGWIAVPLPGNAPKENHPPDNGQTAKQAAAPPAAYGSYDAIRVYLWAGIADPGMSYARDLPKAVPGMAAYLKTNLTPPLQIDSSGKVISPDGPAGFSAAVIPYLQTLGMKDAAATQLQRLNATKDPATGLYGRTVAYYDQNLALFTMAWLEQRYRFDKQGHLKLTTPK